MQIRDLINKDFKKVFPTIIGDEEGKISISDLMDTSHNIIISEIQKLTECNQDEKTELISFLKLMEDAEMDIEYDSHIHYLLKRFAEKHPEHKSFRFCEYRYVLNTITNNKDLTQEFLTSFYNKVLVDYELMNLADFIQESGFGNSIILLHKVNDEILDMLKDALLRYPQKITLLWITAHIYRLQENYQEAIRFNKLFLEKVESIRNSDSMDDIDLDFVDEDSEQLVCFQLADQLFDIGNYNDAIYYCNRVLDQEREEIYSETIKYYFFDALIIRIRIHLVLNDNSAFKKDYSELIKATSEEELTGNYSDIIDYAKQMNL